MTAPRARLGIDFGTSTTVAVLSRPDGRVQQLLFDGSPLLSSAVLLGADGRLHTGRDAAHLARSAPERLEPNPKRRVDDTSVLLADVEVGVRDLVGAVLGRVAAEAARVAGPVRDVTMTHPANWGPGRRALLADAARGLGFDTVELVAEPVAAAASFAHTHGARLPDGAGLLVYDLGAGTCDVTLLRRRSGGFEPVASDGLNDLGGLDVDAAIVGYLESTYGPLWTDRATRARLWDDVRSAKEMLSRASGTVVTLPASGREVPLGREQLEGLARPVLRPSIAMTRALLARAGVRPDGIAGLFLVGGSSRMPLVATMLHEALGVAPLVAEQPELVVAEGALRSAATAPPAGMAAMPVSGAPSSSLPVSTLPFASAPVSSAPFASAPVSSAPVFAEPVSPAPVSAALDAPLRRPRGRLWIVAGAAGLLAIAGVVFAISQWRDDGGQKAGPIETVKYDFTKVPDDLCGQLDLTALQPVYETVEEAAAPSRNLTGQSGTANCIVTRGHRSGTIARIFVSAMVFSANEPAAENYRTTLGDTAKVNAAPAAVTGLGDEAVIFQAKDSSQRAKTDLTLFVGARDGNLIWTLRLTVTRSDRAGWTAAELQDLRDRLVTVTRTSLPTVAAALT